MSGCNAAVVESSSSRSASQPRECTWTFAPRWDADVSESAGDCPVPASTYGHGDSTGRHTRSDAYVFLGVDSINLVSRQPWSVGGPPRGGNGMAASQCPAPWDAGVRTEVSVENLRMGIDAPGSDSLALRLLVTAAPDEAIPADSRAIELRDVAVEGVQRQKPTLFLDRAPCPSLMPAHHPPSPPSSTDGSRSTLLHAKP
jgi:hypothetical protein